MLIKVHCSSELSHGTCHFGTRYTGISNVYGNLKYQDLCMCKALSKLYAWHRGNLICECYYNYHYDKYIVER